MKTLAHRYNEAAFRLMPHMTDDLLVPSHIDSASQIDQIVFRRGEFLGGMAAVLLAVAEAEAFQANL